LGELIQLSERKVKEVDKVKEGGADGEETETTFSTAMSDSQSAPSAAAILSVDAKFEKKVTFARLLSKVSAEMSSGSEVIMCNLTYLKCSINQCTASVTLLPAVSSSS
jgi:hypothetical protein